MPARMRPFQLSTLTIASVICTVFLMHNVMQCHAKVFGRCELAQQLHKLRFGLSIEEIANWVCIAEHSSGLNSAAYASSFAGGSHGIFQISDVYWCSSPGNGVTCNLPCDRLRDDDLTDDMACVRIIFSEHQRLSGNGYTAWKAYEKYCRYGAQSYIHGCFANDHTQEQHWTNSYQRKTSNQALTVSSNFINHYTPIKQGKIYNKCELAKELYFKHKMPMEQIPTWVCIAQRESNFDTSAVGRLNADGSADHGLFQISDLYWCSNDRIIGGKACGLSCSKLLDNDITDDVRCIRRIHNEHTRLSGDGFTAWTVYGPHCRNQYYEHISHCFNQKTQLTKSYAVAYTQPHTHAYAHAQAYTHTTPAHQHQYQYKYNPFLKHAQDTPYYTSSYHSSASGTSTAIATHNHVPYKQHKGKVYNRCELAQELFFKYKFPIQDIAMWVCIAEHESNFDTSAVGRLNGDGSADHGLFQVSDLYWCTHDDFGGKGCGLPCHKLLDSDLTDDIKCIQTIHDEHTRISGDGFTAWTVYNRDCQGRMYDISDCFDDKTQNKTLIKITKDSSSDVGYRSQGKIYSECELAQELLMRQKLPLNQIATWVCIAKYESNYNTAALGRLNNDGSADHGIFQISDLYWCSVGQTKGKACTMPCHKLLDSDITDDVQCIKTIYAEHTRLSGDGFTAWTVYDPHCRHQKWERISKCFGEDFNATKYDTPVTSISQTKKDGVVAKGKVYKKCELARELHLKHKIPIEQVPTWVCIAQHESNYDTSAVGRLNADGSADHGLFQVSDLYWCSHGSHGGKACNIPCHKLLDSDITDDVHCIKIIFDEHTRISGDGFTAWSVYKPHCQHQKLESVSKCFHEKEIQHSKREEIAKPTSQKRKIYKKCELAQELYFKHKMPMWQVPTWVCIAQYESSFDTSAVGRLNADGSKDHGLFQISDLYWCSHDKIDGKVCNIRCDKLLDSDITDDVRCIKIIYDEHTRISGDGFNAWTVYNGHCRNQRLEKVKNCFDNDLLEKAEREFPQTFKPTHKHVASPPNVSGINYNSIADYDDKSLKPKLPVNHPFIENPFLNKKNATFTISATTPDQPSLEAKLITKTHHQTSATHDFAPHPNYIVNPFLKKFIRKEEKLDKNYVSQNISEQSKVVMEYLPTELEFQKPNYSYNPFLSKITKSKMDVVEQQKGETILVNSIEQPEKITYHRNQVQASNLAKYATNPFLSSHYGMTIITNHTDGTKKVLDHISLHQNEESATTHEQEIENVAVGETKVDMQHKDEGRKEITKKPATFLISYTEKPFQYNPFLANHPVKSTKPIIPPTESSLKSTVSIQAPKPNNYLNSDLFRQTVPTQTISEPTGIKNSKSSSKSSSFRNYDFSSLIKTMNTTSSKATKTTSSYEHIATKISKTVSRPLNVQTITTHRPLNTTTSQFSTNKPLIIAKSTAKPFEATKLQTATTKLYQIGSTKSVSKTKITKQQSKFPQTGGLITTLTTKQPMTSFQVFTSKTTPTTKAYRKNIQNLYNTTKTTTRPTALLSTKSYKQQLIPKSPQHIKTTTSKKPTTTSKKPSTTNIRLSQLNYPKLSTTPKPKSEKWSYNWADYFFKINKTTLKTTTTKPTIGTTSKNFNNSFLTTKSPYKNATTKTYNRFAESSKTSKVDFRSKTTTISTNFTKYTTTSRPTMKPIRTIISSKQKTATLLKTTSKSPTTSRLTSTGRHMTTIKPTTGKIPLPTNMPKVTNFLQKTSRIRKGTTTSRPTTQSQQPNTVMRIFKTTGRPSTTYEPLKTTSRDTKSNRLTKMQYANTTSRPTTTNRLTTPTNYFKTASRNSTTRKSTTTKRPFTIKYPTKTTTTTRHITTSRYTTTKNPFTLSSFSTTRRPTTNNRPLTIRKPTTTSTNTPIHSTIQRNSNTYSTRRLATTANLAINKTITSTSLTSSEYADKYRKDPFSHPFFAKYIEQFELLFGRRKNNTTSNSQLVTSLNP